MCQEARKLQDWKNGGLCYKCEQILGKGIAYDNLKAEDGPNEPVVSVLNLG